MASCSRDSKYVGEHVFLSHSGKQKNFVRQLYEHLTAKGMSCFFDASRESLPLGEEWAPIIFKVAETCRVAVLFISKDFIESRWPMLELSAFVKAKYSDKNRDLKILPIFWNISTDYLKKLTSNTQDIPEWTKLGILEEQQKEWKEALRKVPKSNGVLFEEGENEEKKRDEIIEGIIKLLPSLPYSTPVDTVGLAEGQQKVIELLQWEYVDTPPLAVVIYGFGGIGKTTLAEAVLAEIKPHHCARVNFNMESSKKDITKMQEKIVKDLFPRTTKTKFTECWEGRTEMTKAFKEGGTKPIFLFIDNVPGKQDLQELLPRDMRDLPSGSRILVTTRDLRTTDMFLEYETGIKRQEYVVQHLSDKDAKEFLLKAHADRQLDNIEEKDVKKILEVCKGVPLVLKIVRGHFRKQRYSADSCSQILEALEKGEQIKEEDLGKTLTDFVYDQLEESSQQAFLDICCFFNDMDSSHVEYIVGAQELTSLKEAAFVQTSGEKKTLTVHDIIRERGRNKAESTRIMNVESLNIAANEQRLKDIRGVWLNSEDEHEYELQEQQLKAMKKLRVLALGKRMRVTRKVTFKELKAMIKLRVLALGKGMRVSNQCEVEFKELRYLQAGGDIPCLPVNLMGLPKLAFYKGPLFKNGFSMDKLPKELRVIIAARQSDYKSTYSEESKVKNSSLKELNLSLLEKLHKVPPGLHLLTSLQILRWNNGDQMEVLPEGVCQLTTLPQLTLSAWRLLTCLPKSFGELKGLKHLDLSCCIALKRLPDSFVQLEALEKLSLSGCLALLCLPESFGKLKALNELNLTYCRALKCLPESFGEFNSLKSLDLFHCYTLESLPESIGQVKALETLTLRYCVALPRLPESFGKLKALKGLDLKDCQALEHLPESFRELTSLLYVGMSNCPARADLSKFEANLKHGTIVDEGEAKADFRQRDATFKRLFIEDRAFKIHTNKVMFLTIPMEDEKSKTRVLKVIAGVPGVLSVAVDMNEKIVTVTGEMDPDSVMAKLRKFDSKLLIVRRWY